MIITASKPFADSLEDQETLDEFLDFVFEVTAAAVSLITLIGLLAEPVRRNCFSIVLFLCAHE